MNKYDIIATIARERRVETICRNIAKREATRPEVQDLCQEVYEILLGKSEATIVDAWDNGWINFLLVRILQNQFSAKLKDSPWRREFYRYSVRCVSIDGYEGEDTADTSLTFRADKLCEDMR